jgi:hypothetical protein
MSLVDLEQSTNNVSLVGIAAFASASAAIASASLLNLASGGALLLILGVGSSPASPLVIPQQHSELGVQIISVRSRSNPAVRSRSNPTVKLLGPGDPKVLQLLKDSIIVDFDR